MNAARDAAGTAMTRRDKRCAAVCGRFCALLLACDLARAGEGEIGADMAGRWQLHAFGGNACSLEFSGSPGIPHGIVTTTGFCPAVFFARPKWWLDAGQVVVGKRRREPLATFTPVWRGALDGRTVAGEWLSLTR
jgi:hypothetical protein